ncbi:TetR/AcrR family transcriptional regulator [uncultured Lacinutrix sp.]|uniref:TetR/AcrR family transcriptional regulator n=1 Tax=uncultured Lacinutrix sp. TaxID=574032 RepID=UPI00262FA647|nr:TetR/AcrR family transcriptional regulator [uncultured Lacinutrix sp.]
MREKIIHKSTELFLTLGFKSVTMDDIANEMGISKKTIYKHFDNKTQLVETTALSLFELISTGINMICDLKKNPIEEIYDIKRFVMEHLKNEKSSPQYQLQKYYPKIFLSLKQKQFDVMQDCVIENLKRGIALELYRETINVEFISRMYFSGIITIKDNDLFPLKIFSQNMLMEYYLEYHLRGICSPKGLETLASLIKNNQSTIE